MFSCAFLDRIIQVLDKEIFLYNIHHLKMSTYITIVMVTYICPPLSATGVIYVPEGNDSLELSTYVLFVLLLSEFVGQNIVLSLFYFKLQLAFFYLSAFHHLINMFSYFTVRLNTDM